MGFGTINWYFQGIIGEIRIYDHRLSSTERRLLFVEMGTKWGVNMPAQFPVFSGSLSDLAPRTRVAGTVLWFDATDESSIHYGNQIGSVAVWEDLSGLGNHAVMYSLPRAPTIASNAIGTLNALMFNDQHLELTNMQCMAGLTGVTFIVVFRLGDTIPITTPFGNVGPTMNTESVQYGNHLNWLDEAYEIIGSSERINLGSNTALGIAANKTHVLCITGDALDMTRMYINGTQVASWPYGGDYTNYLWAVGRTYGKLFGFPNGWLCFQGAIGEIRIYDHRLSWTERQLVFHEIGTKWSVNIPPQFPVFSGSLSDLAPRTPVAGMALWFDATDESSIHYGNESGSVAVWEDRSGLSNHAVMYSLERAPTIASNSIGAANALMFNDQHLELINKQCMAGLTGVTFMVVFRLGDTIPIITPFGNVGVDMNTQSVQYGSLLNYGNMAGENIGSSETINLGAPAALGIAANKTHFICITGDASDVTRMYINGTEVASWAYGEDYTTYLWAVGREYGKMFGFPNGWLCFQGAIGEIRIYDHRLSVVEHETLFNTMRNKWTVDMPLQIFSDSPTSLPPRTRVAGMTLWFDAMNESSIHYGNETGSVAVWEDLSGLSNHASIFLNDPTTASATMPLERAPTMAIKGIGTSNGLMFNYQNLELTNKQCLVGITGITYMVVFRTGNTISEITPFGNVGPDLDTPSVQYGNHLNWSNEAYEIIGSSTRISLGSNAALGLAANKTHLMCITGDDSDMTRMYVNGTQVATWAYGADYCNYYWAVGRTFGNLSGPVSKYLQGIVVGEIRIYDHRLSTEALTAVHAELQSKWGM